MNEYRKLIESLETINAKGSQFDEDYDSMGSENDLPVTQTDPIDAVTMDIPLLIRLFELMKETVKTDADLHVVVEQIINVSKENDRPLTMEDYNEILNGQSDKPVDEANTNSNSCAKVTTDISKMAELYNVEEPAPSFTGYKKLKKFYDAVTDIVLHKTSNIVPGRNLSKDKNLEY